MDWEMEEAILPGFEDELARIECAFAAPGKLVGNESPEETAAVGNAARVRRHREKKKREKEEMLEENQQLKRGRGELLKQIADLEHEVEGLRSRGEVDLSKENQLLRAEIKRHKYFIDQVVKVTLTTPNETEHLERLRLLRSGIASGQRHIKSLAYSSSRSNVLWRPANVFSLNLTQDIQPVFEPMYQYLPLDAEVDDAKRFNLRLQTTELPLNYKRFARAYWKISSTPELVQEQMDLGEQGSQVLGIRVEIAFPARKLEPGEEVIGLYIRTDACEDSVTFVLNAYKEDQMSFPSDTGAEEGGSPKMVTRNVCLVYTTSCGTLPQTHPKGAQLVNDLFVDGYIFAESDTGGTLLTFVQSLPLSGPLFEFFVDGVLKKRMPISVEGDVAPIARNFHYDRLNTAINNHYER